MQRNTSTASQALEADQELAEARSQLEALDLSHLYKLYEEFNLEPNQNRKREIGQLINKKITDLLINKIGIKKGGLPVLKGPIMEATPPNNNLTFQLSTKHSVIDPSNTSQMDTSFYKQELAKLDFCNAISQKNIDLPISGGITLNSQFVTLEFNVDFAKLLTQPNKSELGNQNNEVNTADNTSKAVRVQIHNISKE